MWYCGMFREVFAVAADRHLARAAARHCAARPGGRAPARRGLLEPVEQRVEARVVDHHGAAIGVALLHADVLPELDRDGALGEGRVQALLDACEPGRPVAAGGVEGCRKGDPVGIGARERRGIALLHGDRREVAVVDVDRQHPEAVGRGARRERGHVAVQVHVHVDLLDGRRSPASA